MNRRLGVEARREESPGEGDDRRRAHIVLNVAGWERRGGEKRTRTERSADGRWMHDR